MATLTKKFSIIEVLISSIVLADIASSFGTDVLKITGPSPSGGARQGYTPGKGGTLTTIVPGFGYEVVLRDGVTSWEMAGVRVLYGGTTSNVGTTTAPSVTIAGSKAGVVGSTQSFQAKVSDGDNPASKVELLRMANATTLDTYTILDADFFEPYLLSWTPANAGNFILRTRVTDSTNATNFSSPLQVVVQATTASTTGQWITSPKEAPLEVEGSAYDAFFNKSTVIGASLIRTSTDGKNIKMRVPDGVSLYGDFLYPNDSFAFAKARPDLVTADEILGWLNWYKEGISANNGWQVPNRRSIGGAFLPVPQGASRVNLDNQTSYINWMWQTYKLTGDTSWFIANQPLLDHILFDGLPRDAEGIIYIPNSAIGQPLYPQHGFNDSMNSSGYCSLINMHDFQAFNQMAEVAYAAGKLEASQAYLVRAAKVQDFTNTTLYDPARKLYRMATLTGSGVHDVWASLRACYFGLASDPIALAISTEIASNPEKYQQEGAVRQVPIGEESAPGYRTHEACVDSSQGNRDTPGTAVKTLDPLQSVGSINLIECYQNGGRWPYLSDALLYTIALTNRPLARQIFAALSAKIVATNGQEWWSGNAGRVSQYGASMAGLTYVTRGAIVVPPLTIATSYRVAYALRGIYPLSEYSGYILRLAKSSDMSQFVDIGFQANSTIYDYAQHNNAVTAGYNKVCWVYDQTGNGRHAKQTDASKCPSSTLHFDGTYYGIEFQRGQYLVFLDTFNNGIARSEFLVARNLVTSGDFSTQLFGQVGDNAPGKHANFEFRKTGAIVGWPYYAIYGDDFTDGTAPTTDIVLSSFLYDGTTGHLRRNGAEIASKVVMLDSPGVGYIGCPESGYNSHGVFYEAIQAVAVNQTQTTQIEGDEISLYGITREYPVIAPDGATFDQDNNSVIYSTGGNWQQYAVPEASGDDHRFRYTEMDGAYVTYRMIAGYSRLVLSGYKDANGAAFDIYVNNQKVGNGSQFNANPSNGLYYDVTGLKLNDDVKIVKTGGGDLYIDLFTLYN